MRKGGLLTNLAAAGDDPLRIQYSRLYWRCRFNRRYGSHELADKQQKELDELREVLIANNKYNYRPYIHPPEPVVDLPPIPGDWSDPISP
jgi:hypothetical protein